MIDRKSSVPWRAIVQGTTIVYGVSFAAGFALALSDITPQSAPNGYPILALVAGAIGVAIALRVAQTTRLAYLIGIGIGFWLISGTSVFFGAQSVLSWLGSSVFAAATVLLGRLLIGTGVDISPTPILSYSALVQRATRTHRNT